MHDLELNASQQLDGDLEASIIQALSTCRPILTHWNADTTWSLSLAYPPNFISSSGRLRYNILIDSWLAGPRSDAAGWFSTQWHAIKSSVQTVAEFNDLLQEVEALASRVESAGQKSKRKSECSFRLLTAPLIHRCSRCVPRVHRPLWVAPLLRNISRCCLDVVAV